MTNDKTDSTSPVVQAGKGIFRERFFFFLMLAILVILGLILIWPYLTEILTALAIVVIIKPLYDRILQTRGINGKERRATAATIVVFILLIAIPIVIFIFVAYQQFTELLTDPATDGQVTSATIFEGIETFFADLSIAQGSEADGESLLQQSQEAISKLASSLSGLLTSIILFLSQFFVGVLIVLVIMMVLLPRFKPPEREQLTNLAPLPADITQLYLDKVRLMIDAMFKGTFFLAFLEGLAMGLVFFIAGVPYTFLLTILSMFLALLPMIGISLIAWPIGIILILSGQVAEGVFVIVAFLLFVANIDTVLRPKLVPKAAYLNPALTMLSVFGGLSLMGFIGLIYGPVIMILLVTSVEVYGKYIMRTDLEPYLAEDGSLDMEKLGLREREEEQSDSGSTRNIIHRVANLVTSRVTNQDDKESLAE